MGKAMIFKHPNSRCIAMTRRKVLLIVGVSCSVLFSLSAVASTINKPASAVMDHAVGDGRDMGRSPISKSRVVPLKRKMDLASGSPVTKSNPQVQPEKKSQHLNHLQSRQPNKENQTAQGKAKVKADEVKQFSSDSKVEEIWDSAAMRYDQTDPAKSVTKGVRVEDIIEPTFDYRYSSARRKNPFIPEVILTGRTARQRELSPNDVEIPIVSPLQSFPVARLAVIGVWETDNGVWKALIKTPATQGIEAKLGDPIGNSGGRLMSINPDSVVVREFSVRSDGTREYRDIPLYMGSDVPTRSEDQTGGRLILRPGATEPEIIPPQASIGSPTDAVITVTPPAVRGELPGTLKTVESLPPISTSGLAHQGAAVKQMQPGQERSAAEMANMPSLSTPANVNSPIPSTSPNDSSTEVPPVGVTPNEPMNSRVNSKQ